MDEKEDKNDSSKKSLKKKKKKPASKEKNQAFKLDFKVKGIIIAAAAVLAVYIILSCYFCNHFYIGTKINNISVSGKTVDKADEEISNKVQNYKITLKERNDKEEEIAHDNLKLSYDGRDNIQKIKDSQKPFAWIINIFSDKNYNVDDLITYSDKDVTKSIDALACFKKENIIDPKNVSFEYDDDEYKIIDADKGCKADKSLVKDAVVKSIEDLSETVNLDSENCYIVPKYSSGDEKVNEAKNELDKYMKTKINYVQGDKNLSLDGSIIHEWLSVNDEMEVTFNEKKISGFLKTLSKEFNTVGNTREFTTTSGALIKVSGGDYGWKVDKDAEKTKIIEAVKEGASEEREPIYSKKAASHDGNEIGNTYVEVSLKSQHLWFYKNGQLIIQGDVVTGNTSAGHGTPSGVYYVEYKERNATLVGPGYSTPVSFWMPFNGGIGLHDATWRGSFGGSIYSYNGSHGCVNCPYSLAQSLYNTLEAGTPVICY